jgi:3-oxoacyl-[acyl-carrier protein] reductase
MLRGKTAVVTGGSRGIGAAIALKLASLHADVAIIYSSGEDAAAETQSKAKEYGVTAEIYACNVADFENCKNTVDAIVSDFGKIDILINNAGITKDKLIIAMKEEDFDAVLDVNLKGVFNMIRHISPLMVRAKGGKIVNISSISGIIGNKGQANYVASKAGIIGLTKTVAKELSRKNITCNAVAPGFINTEMTKDLKGAELMLEAIPAGRFGEPEDIANCVAFLASQSADYITGEVIRVDGGMAM